VGEVGSKSRIVLRRSDLNATAVKRSKAVIKLPYTGAGPQVQIDEGGNVCLVYLHDMQLVTALWPAKQAALSESSGLAAASPLENCGTLKFDVPIQWFQLHRWRDRFYLITNPDSGTNAFVRVYALHERQWKPVGEPLRGLRGKLAFDEVTGDLYVGIERSHAKVEGTTAAVFRWEVPAKKWAELSTPAAGLRESFGVTSYPGVGCPTVVAHRGQVWAFWWFGNWLQGATYRDGAWHSCARSLVPAWSEAKGEYETEKDSLGAGNGLFFTLSNTMDDEGVEAFYDEASKEVVVFIADGAIGLVVRDGKTHRITYARKTSIDGAPTVIPGLTRQGRGFDNMISTGPMVPHTIRAHRCGRALYLHATISKDGNYSGADVFVFKLVPRPITP
jgi:hypothetical protein